MYKSYIPLAAMRSLKILLLIFTLHTLPWTVPPSSMFFLATKETQSSSGQNTRKNGGPAKVTRRVHHHTTMFGQTMDSLSFGCISRNAILRVIGVDDDLASRWQWRWATEIAHKRQHTNDSDRDSMRMAANTIVTLHIGERVFVTSSQQANCHHLLCKNEQSLCPNSGSCFSSHSKEYRQS